MCAAQAIDLAQINNKVLDFGANPWNGFERSCMLCHGEARCGKKAVSGKTLVKNLASYCKVAVTLRLIIYLRPCLDRVSPVTLMSRDVNANVGKT